MSEFLYVVTGDDDYNRNLAVSRVRVIKRRKMTVLVERGAASGYNTVLSERDITGRRMADTGPGAVVLWLDGLKKRAEDLREELTHVLKLIETGSLKADW